MTDADKRTNRLHLGVIRQTPERDQSGPEIWIRIPDEFRLTFRRNDWSRRSYAVAERILFQNVYGCDYHNTLSSHQPLSSTSKLIVYDVTLGQVLAVHIEDRTIAPRIFSPRLSEGFLSGGTHRVTQSVGFCIRKYTVR